MDIDICGKKIDCTPGNGGKIDCTPGNGGKNNQPYWK